MNESNHTLQNQEISLSEQIRPYLQKWWAFIVSVVLFVFLALLYLRYASDVYQADASILIKDTQAGSGISELGALGDIGMLGNNFNTVENEIEILTSRRLMSQVVADLNLNVKYFNEGNIKTSEIFQSTPFEVVVVEAAEKIGSRRFYVQMLNNGLIEFWQEDADNTTRVALNNPIAIDEELTVMFKATNWKLDNAQEENLDYLIKVYPFEATVINYTDKLNAQQSVKRGSVIDLSMTDPVPSKAAAILNQLIEAYNEDAIADKNLVAQNTVDFIEDRLASIELSLDSVEIKKERFKRENNLSDIVAEATLNLESSAKFSAQEVEAETQLQIARDLQNYIAGLENNDYIPANLTLESAPINTSIAEYNELLLLYNQRTETATELNPIVQDLQFQLDKLQKAIAASLDSYIKSLEIRLRSISRQNRVVDSRIGEVPSTERTARDIERDQSIVEAIYLYLFQKKEETAISLAVTAPKAKVVDRAWVADNPISPKPRIILLGSFTIGLIIPFAFIYFKELFYNKIESRKDVTKRLPNMTLLGEVPKLDSDDSDMVQKNDRSVLAESFRILRTNLQYKLSALPDKSSSPCIIVTSSVKGEGKTFVSYNLAMTMANSGKKVLLIGGDIRNPQLHRYLQKGSKSLKGVTEFLVYPEYKPEDFVHQSDANNNLRIMLSGSIPPNPAELWLSDRVDELIAYAKSNFDAVIIDSAPSMLVTDTLLISDKADVTVYVTRANYTEKPLLDYIGDTIDAGKLKNVAMVLNNVKIANFGYGNKYAYSYGVDQVPAWKQLLIKLKLKK